MNTNELRGKSQEELTGMLLKLRGELQTLRLEHRAQGLADVSRLQKQRRVVAQVMTVLREKEILSGSN